MVVPSQPWLDGFSVEKGFIRQFVAMPLGSGYSAEEQLTGEAEFGGLQVMVFPMQREVFEQRFPKIEPREVKAYRLACFDEQAPAAGGGMGLAPGGRMRQHIYEDPYAFGDWDRTHSGRCFVHLTNSLVWRSTTGAEPPTVPPTSAEYNEHGLPWFDYYDEKATALGSSKRLEGLESVAQMAKQRGDNPLPENESVTPQRIVELRRGMEKDQVRESRF